jgi:hypothetical protein
LPIFSGGVDAVDTQALADADRVKAQLQGDQKLLAVDIRRQFQATQTGQAKIEALQEAVIASTVAQDGAQRGLVAGVRTTMDGLEATRRLFRARRDFVQARYEVLLARLRLQVLARLPLVDIVQDIDRHSTVPIFSERLAGRRARCGRGRRRLGGDRIHAAHVARDGGNARRSPRPGGLRWR